MSLLALAWMSEIGLMTYRITKRGRPPAAGGYRVPWPADYVGTFVVFGSLSVLAELGDGWDSVAAAIGWGLVLATVLNLVDPTNPTAKAPRSAQATAKAPSGGTLRAETQPAQGPPANTLAQRLGG